MSKFKEGEECCYIYPTVHKDGTTSKSKDDCEILKVGSHSKYKIKTECFGTEWVDEKWLEKKYNFEEGEKCYFDDWEKKRECVIEKVLNKTEENVYLIYIPNRELYVIAYERDLLKRKDFEDLEEGESFYLPSGEKISILRIEFDDYEGVYKYLIKREHGEIRLVHKEILKGWI